MQTIKSVDGQEFVLLPIECYIDLKEQIDRYYFKEQQTIQRDYIPFVLENYVKNPVALARINLGVSQTELAALMNVSQAYVSKLERRVRVTPQTMRKVQAALSRYCKR